MKISLIAEAIRVTAKSKASCPLCKGALEDSSLEEPANCDRCGTTFHPECVEDMLRHKNCPLLGCKGKIGLMNDQEVESEGRLNEINAIVKNRVDNEAYDLETFGLVMDSTRRDPDTYRIEVPDIYRLYQLNAAPEEIERAYRNAGGRPPYGNPVQAEPLSLQDLARGLGH